MNTLQNEIESMKQRAEETARAAKENADELTRFLDALTAAYPSIAPHLKKMPFLTGRGLGGEAWVTVEAPTLRAGLEMLKGMEAAPLLLTRIKNGCTAIRPNVSEAEYNLEKMDDVGCVLLQHENEYRQNTRATWQTLRAWFPLAGFAPFRLSIEIQAWPKTQITAQYEEHGHRRILTGWTLPYTFNGERIKWASGSIDYPNTFTEMFGGCNTLEDLEECYPQLFEG